MRATTALLCQAAYVAAGVGLLAAASALPASVPQPVALAFASALLYVAAARWVFRTGDPLAPWRPSRLPVAALWLLGGAGLHAISVVVTHPGALADGADRSAGLSRATGTSLALTFAAVLWEELWFRNPVLNLVRGRRPQIAFALGNGALFTALHVLNPKFDLLVGGPEVLAAGTLLTLVYFASGSFWAPLALHLGNNLASSVLHGALPEASAAQLDAPGTTLPRAGVLAATCVVVAVRFLRDAGESPAR